MFLRPHEYFFSPEVLFPPSFIFVYFPDTLNLTRTLCMIMGLEQSTGILPSGLTTGYTPEDNDWPSPK